MVSAMLSITAGRDARGQRCLRILDGTTPLFNKLLMRITEGEHQREHEEQDMQRAWFSRGEVEQMIVEGEITDAQSIAAWSLFLLVARAN